MKTCLLLLSLATIAPAAHAESLVRLSMNASRQIVSAQSDVAFLRANAANCTSYASTISGRLLAPVSSDLEATRVALVGGLAKYTEKTKNGCNRPSARDLQAISEMAAAAAQRIDAKLALASQPQSALMGMTGDVAMTRALSTDGSYPKCVAANPADPQSTPELKSYFSLKQKLARLRGSIEAIRGEADQLARGSGSAICLK